MGRLLIEKLKYSGDSFEYESPTLGPGINILEGANATGKTTFTNLIYYGLGGHVEEFRANAKERHAEITGDKNNFVDLFIRINETPYQLRRYIGDPNIGITHETITITRTLDRRESSETFSDWLLDKLGFEIFEIFQGSHNWRINFTDLARLIYHDQNTGNVRSIFKAPDTSFFLSDSASTRKIIFEVLTGKTFNDYYSTLGKTRRADQQRQVTKETLRRFIEIAATLHSENQPKNSDFIEAALREKQTQHEKLEESRRALQSNAPQAGAGLRQRISEKTSELTAQQHKRVEFNSKRSRQIGEVVKLRNLREDRILEATQMRKIIYSHDELKLFSPNTCPYCLREIDRNAGACVCGKPINEEDYEKFFYDREEYLDILKAKQKSIETIEIAIESVSKDLKATEGQLRNIDELIKGSSTEIENLSRDIETGIDLSAFNEIENKLLGVRSEIQDLQKDLELRTQQDIIEKEHEENENEYKRLLAASKSLELEAAQAMEEILEIFSKKYKELIRSSLPEVNTAAIQEDYMPVIDGGIYKQASSAVPRRLLYYFALLHISLQHPTVLFPRLLIIDTPENLGIDYDVFMDTLQALEAVIPAGKEEQYQVILSTGVNKYPESYAEYVFESLSTDNRLLKEVGPE